MYFYVSCLTHTAIFVEKYMENEKFKTFLKTYMTNESCGVSGILGFYMHSVGVLI